MSDRRLRVSLVIANLGCGGAQTQLLVLAKGLVRHGHTVQVCCVTMGGSLEDDLKRIGIEVVILGKRNKFDFTVLWKLVRTFRRFRPEIVHCHLFTANLWGRLAAWWCGIPGIAASVLSLDEGRGVVSMTIDRLLSHVSRRVICNAEAILEHLVRNEGIPRGKLAVVHNGIDASLFGTYLAEHARLIPQSARLAVSVLPDRPVVGMVCRFDPRKNIELFLDACELILQKRDDVQFLLVGDAEPRRPDEVAYKTRVLRRLGHPPLASTVRLAGFFPDVRPFLAAMDVFLLTSWTEGFPNALMEAMAMGCPVVSTRVGGVGELVRSEIDGILVECGDAREMADAVVHLLDHPTAARAMGRSARERVQREFSAERMVTETTRIYEEVMR